MKNIPVAIVLALSVLVFACQNNAYDDNNANMSETDTTHTGLEGTRDQSATVTGSEVIQDTTAGQSPGVEKTGEHAGSGGLPGGPNNDSPAQKRPEPALRK